MENLSIVVRKYSIYYLVIFLLLLGGIISDILNGLIGTEEMSLSVSSILRGSFVITGLIYIVFCKKTNFIFKFYLLSLVIIYFVSELFINIIFEQKKIFLFVEISHFLKLMYIPVISIVIYIIIQQHNSLINKILIYLSFAGFLESLAVVVPYLLGFGNPTYTQTQIGSRGILLNPNEIALSLIIAQTITIWLLLYYKNKRFFLFLFLLTIAFGELILSTRTSILGSIFIFIATPSIIFISEIFAKKDLNKKLNKITFLVIVIVGITLSTSLYINFKKNEYLLEKMNYFLKHLNARGDLQKTGYQVIINSPPFNVIFGNTFSGFFYKVQEEGNFYSYHKFGKRVEVDWIDILGSLGLIFLYIIYIFYICILISSLKNFIRYRRKENAIYFFILLLFISHSILAGHALMAPLPGTYIAPIISLVLLDNKTKRRINFERKTKISG